METGHPSVGIKVFTHACGGTIGVCKPAQNLYTIYRRGDSRERSSALGAVHSALGVVPVLYGENESAFC